MIFKMMDNKTIDDYLNKIKNTYDVNNHKKDIENVKIENYVFINFNDTLYAGILKSIGKKNIKILSFSSTYGEQELKFEKRFLFAYISKKVN
jgi:hypothetical protein